MKANIEAIKAKCIIDAQECWLWTGSITKDGYAQMHVPSVGVGSRGHRITYTMVKGPIPEGLQLDHLCRNRGCINPNHLEPVTGAENVRRGESISNELAARTHCLVGHEYTAENTYLTPRGLRNCRRCILIRHKSQKLARYRRNYYRTKNTESGRHGVVPSWDKKTWQARVTVDKKLVSLGYFTNINEAIAVRDKYQEDVWARITTEIEQLKKPDTELQHLTGLEEDHESS